MSMCAHSTPFSTKHRRKAAAWQDAPSGFPAELVRSAHFGLMSSAWQSSTGMCQSSSSASWPRWRREAVSAGELEKRPARSLPRATMMAPVRVDSSSSVPTLQFCCTQCMQSASTSLPSASVLPISTVSPFRDRMMSSGLQLLLLTKFSARPTTATRFTGSFSRTALSNALRTEQAPCLSLCMPEMPEVGLRLSPPESKHNPFPTRPTNCSSSRPPRHSRLTKAGSFLLALPTACSSVKPSSSSWLPLMMVRRTEGQAVAMRCASCTSCSVFRSFPLEAAHSAACILALASSRMYSRSTTSSTPTSIVFSAFSFRENLYPRVRISEASPAKLEADWTAGEKQSEVFLGISLIFFQAVLEQNLVVASLRVEPSPDSVTAVAAFFSRNSVRR